MKPLDIGKLCSADLPDYNISELVCIYLTAFKIPSTWAIQDFINVNVLKRYYYDFRDFISKTRQCLTIKQFAEYCQFHWNLIPDDINPQVSIQPGILEFSFFKRPISNITSYEEIDLKKCYQLIEDPNNYEAQTKELRAISDPKKQRIFKSSNFDYVTFSGTFKNRKESDLLKHSGLLVLDFDKVKYIEELKNRLFNDAYFETELLFISPSGEGLKWVIKIDLNQGTHYENFQAVANYLKETYNIEVDSTGRDVSRACFLSYDKDVYINLKYLK
jgi:hypothetical protein